jgi:hypothetical protein
VYDAIAQDPSFFRFLSQIDAELAAETRGAGCQHCSGRLHTADFPRKPRGCPVAVIEEYSWRLSFTCGRCDSRATPPSVRFLGRRVYVAVVLMLSSPPNSTSARQLQLLVGASGRTVLRWRRWWTQEFTHTRLWRSLRSRLIPPITPAQLPQGLLDRMRSKVPTTRLAQVLHLLSPLSVSYVIR